MKGLKINKVNFTTKVDPEWIERIRQIIAANPLKYRSQGHFVEVALDRLIRQELNNQKEK